MRMSPKSAVRLHQVVIVHEQQTMVRVGRIIMVREAEAVPRIQPPSLRMEPVFFATDLHIGSGLLCMPYESHDGASFPAMAAIVL
jgi:hypothetical protein